MNLHKRIHELEEHLDQLAKEKTIALHALERAAELGSFKTKFGEVSQPLDILDEAVKKICGLIKFKAAAFYLVDENDSDFHMVLCSNEQYRPFIERETAQLIDDTIFSWVLGRNKPFTMSSQDASETLLMHAIATPARTRGMFIGVLDQDRSEILDISLSLITILLLFTATLLESFETYAYISDINRELRDNVDRLAESERQLMRHRDNLETEVQERTLDLSKTNAQLTEEADCRRKTQEALRKERDFIDAILNTAGALILVMDRFGNVLRMNRALEELTGINPEQALGRSARDVFLSSGDLRDPGAGFARNFDTPLPTAIVNELRTPSGNSRLVSWSQTATYDDDGSIAFVVASGLDITEHKKAEQALRNSEAKFRAVFTDAGMGIAIGSRHGRILDLNPMFERMFDRNRSELLNLPFYELIHPQDSDAFVAHLDSIITGYRSSLALEQRFMMPSDAILWGRVTITPVSSQSEDVRYFIIMIEDVTESKRMEMQLREAEKTYRNIFEHAVEGIFQGFLHGPFTRANPALAAILGLETPEALMEAVDDISTRLCEEEAACRTFERMLNASGAVSNYEMQALREDGRTIWLSVSARVVSMPDDSRGPLIEGLVDDVTNAKLATLRLEHKATMDELTQIPNRNLFLERFEQLITRAQAEKTQLTLLYIDLDNFKLVNDSHGHLVGDKILKQAAQRIAARVRHSDLVARLGGDEFTVLLQDPPDEDGVFKIAQDIVRTVSQPYKAGDVECIIGASIGISSFPQHGSTTESLLQAADQAMYQAKENNRNVHFHKS